LRKSEAAALLGVEKQWINYRSKEKNGTLPKFVSKDGEKIDVENEYLLGLVQQKKMKAQAKVARGEKKTDVVEKPKKTTRKKTSKKSVKKNTKKNNDDSDSEEETDFDVSVVDKDYKPESKDMHDLIEDAQKAKCMQEIYKAADLKSKYETNRGDNVNRKLTGDVVFAYLDTLSKELFRLMVNIEQDARAAIEAGKSSVEVQKILIEPCSAAICEAKKQTKKLLQKKKHASGK